MVAASALGWWAGEQRRDATPRVRVLEAVDGDTLVVELPGGRIDTVRILGVRGLTLDGAAFDFALNLVDSAEWAGACWSHDGKYLFTNTLGTTFNSDDAVPSRTYAIWGPWKRGEL